MQGCCDCIVLGLLSICTRHCYNYEFDFDCGEMFVIKIVGDLQQFCCFLRMLQFLPPMKMTHDLTEILLKKALNTPVIGTDYIYNRKTKSMISSMQTSDSKVWCIKKIVITQSIGLILYQKWNIFKNLELKYSFFYHVKLYNKINIYLSYKQSRTLTKIITFYL